MSVGILHITVSSKSVDALADLYRFTQDQRDILHQLLSEEMRPSLLALCGGIAVADGELCWPLPGHAYISCHFGEVDAFVCSVQRDGGVCLAVHRARRVLLICFFILSPSLFAVG